MAEKGIIIDVGFAPQWKDFLDEIDKELSKLDFDKYLNLDEAFNKQAKEIREKLKNLKKEIDAVINGVGVNPVKAFNELNKSVKSLSGVVLNMAKTMPDGTEYTREINSITNSMEELTSQAQNAADTVNSLNNVSSNGLEFKTQLNQLKELWSEWDKIYKALGDPRAKNKQGKIPFAEEDRDELISKIKAEYDVYVNISNQIDDVREDTKLSTEEMDRILDSAYFSLAQKIKLLDGLARSAQKIGISSSDKVDIGISLESVIKDIDEKLPDVIDHINFAKAKIQNEFTQLGGTEILEEEFQKKAQAEKGIRVTIGLNADSKNVLYKQTIDVINSVQKNLNKPILVEVQLVSAYQSRGNQTLLSQIQEELNNIQDGEVTEKLQGLIDKMNKRVENAFIMNVYLNTQNATNQLRHFIKEMKEEISDLQKLLTINPEFEITPEIRQKLIDEIEEVKTLYQATIDVKFNFDDNFEVTPNDNISEKFNQLYNYINSIESAVNAKTDAFKYEGNLVQFVVEKEIRSLNHLYLNLKKIKSTIDDVAQSLRNINSNDQRIISNNEQSLYHYSNTPFTKFDKKKANKFQNNAFGKALYLTNNPKNYEDFGKYLSEWVFNPDDVKILDQTIGFKENEIEEILNEYYSWCNSKLRELWKKKYQNIPNIEIDNFNKEFGIDLEKILKHLGYDGIYDDINEQYAIFSPEKFRVKQITDTDKNQIVYLNKEKKSIQDTSEVLEQLNIEKENNTKYNEDMADSADNTSNNIDKEKDSINDLSNKIEQLINSSKDSKELILLLKSLHATLNDFSNDKSAERLQKFTENLEKLQRALKSLTNVKDNTFLSSIQDILNKGEELKTFAEILKSTKKELKNAKDALNNQDKTSEGNLYLENYSDVIKERALNNIPDLDYKLMSQSLESTSEGLVKITTLIKTADGEYKKYIHTTTDGEEIQQQKIESGTASILKQAQAIERLNAKAQEEGQELKRIGEIEVEPNTPKWQELVSLIESFGIKLQDVKQIIQTIDESGYESFQVFHGDGLRTTLGMNSKDILYEKNNLVDLVDTTKEFESIIKKLPGEFKKGFKDNGLGASSFIKDLQKLLELYQKLYSLSNAGMNIDMGVVENDLNSLRDSIDNIFKFDPNLFTNELQGSFEAVKDNFLGLFDQISQKGSLGKDEIDALKMSLVAVGEQFDELKNKSNALAGQKSIANILKTVQTELYQNGAMDKEFKTVLTNYRDELQNALDLYNQGMEKEAGLTKERLQEIVAGVMEVQGKIQQSGNLGLSVINKLGKAIKTNFVQYVARYLSIQDIIRYISSAAREVKNIDTALTELRKVSDATTERLQVSLKKSAETAKELGNSIDYVINITSDWARLNKLGLPCGNTWAIILSNR